MEKIRIIITDDHQLFRNGLKILLNGFQEFEVTGEASNGEEFLRLIKNTPADVVLMDINMPELDGIEATRRGLKICPGLSIIALSMYGRKSITIKWWMQAQKASFSRIQISPRSGKQFLL